MKLIESFKVNHDTLTPGIYLSRKDGDVVTYDLRLKRPNDGDFLDVAGLHTAEHLLATFMRSSAYSDSVIYIGPMGCRTGMYLLFRDSISHQTAIDLIREAFAFMASYEGEIPGAQKIECGNYLEHDLKECKREATAYCEVIKNWTVEQLVYPY